MRTLRWIVATLGLIVPSVAVGQSQSAQLNVSVQVVGGGCVAGIAPNYAPCPQAGYQETVVSLPRPSVAGAALVVPTSLWRAARDAATRSAPQVTAQPAGRTAARGEEVARPVLPQLASGRAEQPGRLRVVYHTVTF